MYGPKPIGYWSEGSCARFGPLREGRRYRVIQRFTDVQGTIHEPGEEWIFIGSRTLRYDDGVLLFVSLDVEHEWHIRLERGPGPNQAAVMNSMQEYVTPV